MPRKFIRLPFTARGKYLATGGANQVICWPFFNGGPWGKQPMTLGGADDRLVTRVAPHPRDEIVAAGYEDGMIILSPLDGRMEVMLHPPVSKEAADCRHGMERRRRLPFRGPEPMARCSCLHSPASAVRSDRNRRQLNRGSRSLIKEICNENQGF